MCILNMCIITRSVTVPCLLACSHHCTPCPHLPHTSPALRTSSHRSTPHLGVHEANQCPERRQIRRRNVLLQQYAPCRARPARSDGGGWLATDANAKVVHTVAAATGDSDGADGGGGGGAAAAAAAVDAVERPRRLLATMLRLLQLLRRLWRLWRLLKVVVMMYVVMGMRMRKVVNLMSCLQHMEQPGAEV